MAKQSSSESLKEFNIQKFNSQFDRLSRMQLDCGIQRDGSDAYIITPDNTNPGYAVRVPKSAVTLGALLPRDPYTTNFSGEFRRISVDRGAPSIRMITDSFENSITERLATTLTTLQVAISLDASGEGTLSYGENTVACLGNPEIKYTKDLTIQGVVGTDKFSQKYSNEYEVWMYWAILIMGTRGIYIHEGPDNLKDNNGPSAGCIHLADAKAFYDWVSGRTRIRISYPW